MIQPDSMRDSPHASTFGWICLFIVALACLAFALHTFAREQNRVAKTKDNLQRELETASTAWDLETKRASQAHHEQLAQEEADHIAALSNHFLLSGEQAKQNHAREWERRLSHDPNLAASAAEQLLLKMEQVGKDPQVAAMDALQQVALLASPKGSRVEIVSTNNGFLLKVAFKMSAVSKQEKGAVTKHHSVNDFRAETRELSAKVIRSLFDFCGTRGIEELSVSCNHAMRRRLIPTLATDEERRYLLSRAVPKMHVLYRLHLNRPKADSLRWRTAPSSAILKLAEVGYDGFPTLTISGYQAEPDEDPDTPLEF
jgi:hypothetical protein